MEARKAFVPKSVRLALIEPKNCLSCGNVFIPKCRTQKYCSEKCRIKASNRRHRTRKSKILKKKCVQCGSEFETTNPHKKYCDSSCARNFNRKKQRFGKPKKNYVMGNPVTVQCCVCGIEHVIDQVYSEIPLFYCTGCLKKYGGKTPNSKIEGYQGRRIGVPKLEGI